MHPLVCAARDGMMSEVQTLLDKEPDISQSDKDNALMAACDGNHAKRHVESIVIFVFGIKP